MNSRRKLVVALGAGALAAPFAAFSQQQGRVWRVGVLVRNARPQSIESHELFDPFLKGMRDLGYVEGKNLAIEWRFADNNPERLPDMAAELVLLKVDAIVSGSTPGLLAAQKATTTIPIIMLTSQDPVGDGLVKSLARPGGNITGRTSISGETGPKLLEMIQAAVPRLSRLAVMVNPDNSSHAPALKKIQDAAQKAKLTILPMEVRKVQEFENAFAQMARQKADALIVIREALFNVENRKIAELAVRNRLPAIGSISDFPEAGGLMSYGENRGESPRRAAVYLDKIFKGAKPADLPVEQPTKFELVINGKTATALGLKIPQGLLIFANKIIE